MPFGSNLAGRDAAGEDSWASQRNNAESAQKYQNSNISGFEAAGDQQRNVLARAARLASTALRLAHTISEGSLEGLYNAFGHMYGKLPSSVRPKHKEPYTQDLTGKVAIVTGGNSGIGFATAQQLARRGAHVVLACRDKGRAEAAVQAIACTPALHGCIDSSQHHSMEDTSSTPRPSLRVEAMALDLGRLGSVRAFTEEWRRRGLPLNILVCNAGVMAPLTRTQTPDGLEVQFQVNFLSHWLLTHLLLDSERERRRKHRATKGDGTGTSRIQMAVAAGSGVCTPTDGVSGGRCRSNDDGVESTRVVVVSSVVHRMGLLQWNDLMSERSYEPYITYGASKLATVVFAKELQRRFERHPEYGVQDTAVAVHPGIVQTHLANNFFRSYGLSWAVGTPLEPLQRLWQKTWDAVGHALLATPDQAAARMLIACLGPSERLAGNYMSLGRVYPADKASDDLILAAQLWTIATRLTGYTPPPSLA